MILARDFVFIHVPKTGGKFVRRILEEHAPSHWELREHGHPHGGLPEIPAHAAHLPRFTFVRNPFSWYVSWYHFQKAHDTEDRGFFEEISGGGELGFCDTMRNVLGRSEAEGPYTQTLRSMLMGFEQTRLGRFENLRADLLRILGDLVTIPEPMTRAIHETAPVNASAHGRTAAVYDEEVRELVALRDAVAFEQLGYDAGVLP